jgi:hypothetical protein
VGYWDPETQRFVAGPVERLEDPMKSGRDDNRQRAKAMFPGGGPPALGTTIEGSEPTRRSSAFAGHGLSGGDAGRLRDAAEYLMRRGTGPGAIDVREISRALAAEREQLVQAGAADEDSPMLGVEAVEQFADQLADAELELDDQERQGETEAAFHAWVADVFGVDPAEARLSALGQALEEDPDGAHETLQRIFQQETGHSLSGDAGDGDGPDGGDE